MKLIKAHAYGNDFVYVERTAVDARGVDPADLARRICQRHEGVGADGLVLYAFTSAGAVMRLINADGSPSEVSGNGVRGLAAILARERNLTTADTGGPPTVLIETDAGPKALTLLERRGAACRFRAAMGQPTNLRRESLVVAGEPVDAIALGMGNPQCVVLGALDHARLERLGRGLQHHEAFPEGVNFELATVEAPDRVRILIWERGVGPTRSSGTGSCASAVAAAAFGGALRDVVVEAPGGSQRVEWTPEGVYLTGWAEVLLEGEWLA
ncbi:MAG: dapF [Acidobacteria bacterium]|jgi:diaminopimelate epimerase|nr:dapF [Acidobacteriota bacterium]